MVLPLTLEWPYNAPTKLFLDNSSNLRPTELQQSSSKHSSVMKAYRLCWLTRLKARKLIQELKKVAGCLWLPSFSIILYLAGSNFCFLIDSIILPLLALSKTQKANSTLCPLDILSRFSIAVQSCLIEVFQNYFRRKSYEFESLRS